MSEWFKVQTWNVCVGATPPGVRIPPSPFFMLDKSVMIYSSLLFTIQIKENFMFYNVLKLDDVVKLGEEKFKRVPLLENNNSNLSIVALKKDEIIDTHTSVCNAAVYVVEGEIELHFSAQKFLLDEGDILMFKKDDEHKVLALKDSKFLLIKI